MLYCALTTKVMISARL